MNISLYADSIMCTKAESHCQGYSARLAEVVVDKLTVPTASSTLIVDSHYLDWYPHCFVYQPSGQLLPGLVD